MRALLGYGFLAPPNIFIALCPLGVLLALRWWRTGLATAGLASCCLYIAATPAFSSYLLMILEQDLPGNSDLGSAQAIVVLSADVRNNPNTDGLGLESIERLIFAAQAYQKLRLPVIVSGGSSPKHRPMALLMRSALETYFNIPVRWVEARSRTTYENALYTARFLQAENIRTVILVAQLRDLPRAIWSFNKVGLIPLPWLTTPTVASVQDISDFLPSSIALGDSFYCLHELIGKIYYQLRY